VVRNGGIQVEMTNTDGTVRYFNLRGKSLK
jgi:hypothetical protein